MRLFALLIILSVSLVAMTQDCNVPNCNTCVSGDPKKCETCNVQYYKDSSSQCAPCLSHCDTCTGSRRCQKCEVDYKLEAGIIFEDTCSVERCRVPDCTKCDTTDANKCVTCASVAYLNSKDYQCYKCLVNCNTCKDASEKCTSCAENYSLESSSSQCVVEKCVVTNCTTCVRTNATQCSECNPGSFLNTDTLSCDTCSSNCLTCGLNSSYCTSCNPNYELNATTGVCEVTNCTVPHCIECNNTDITRCLGCDNRFFLNSTTGKCDSCSKGCYSCENGAACKFCDDKYILNEDTNVCDSCPLNCTECTSATVCTICAPYTVLNADDLCEECPANCKNCTSGSQCTVCEDLYGVNSTTSQCDKCSENCLDCVGESQCLSCKNGFGVNKATGFCEVCPENCIDCAGSNSCTTCIGGYGINGTTGLCDLCPSRCSKCSGAFNCDECFEHYEFSSESIACFTKECQVANCWTCEETNATLCKDCSPKFFVEAGTGKCNSCIDRCLSCSDALNCLNCDSHYSFNSTSSHCETSECQISHCLNCSTTDAFICTNCNQAYFLETPTSCQSCPLNCLGCKDGNSCEKCADNHTFNTTSQICHCEKSPYCTTCNGENPEKCADCIYGFFVDSSDQLCKGCALNCAFCKDGSSCTTCAAGHTFSASSNTCECTKSPNCQTCDPNDFNKCATCKIDFSKDNTGLCYQCPLNCESCIDGKTCDKCAAGHTFNSTTNICECQGSANCKTCKSSDASKCQACKDGFFLDNAASTCNACSQNCLECSNSDTCTTCADNYSVNGTTGKCIVSKCQALFCANCIETDAFKCQTCLNGTFLNDTTCAKCKDGDRCNRCSSETQCIECNSQFNLNSNTSKCYQKKCNPQHCKWCYDNEGSCSIAEARFFIDGTGAIKDCPSGCVNCNNATTCSVCDPNTTFNAQKVSCLAPSSSKAWIWILVALGVVAIIAIAIVLYLRKSKPVDELETPLNQGNKSSSAGVL